MNEPLQISLQPESGMPLKRLRKLAQTDSSSSAFADALTLAWLSKELNKIHGYPITRNYVSHYLVMKGTVRFADGAVEVVEKEDNGNSGPARLAPHLAHADSTPVAGYKSQ
jgi:hypothetical protein